MFFLLLKKASCLLIEALPVYFIEKSSGSGFFLKQVEFYTILLKMCFLDVVVKKHSFACVLE